MIAVPVQLDPCIPFSDLIAEWLPQTPQDAARCLVCLYLYAIQPCLDAFVSEYLPVSVVGHQNILNTARVLVSALIAAARPYLEIMAESYFYTSNAGIVAVLETPTQTLTIIYKPTPTQGICESVGAVDTIQKASLTTTFIILTSILWLLVWRRSDAKAALKRSLSHAFWIWLWHWCFSMLDTLESLL